MTTYELVQRQAAERPQAVYALSTESPAQVNFEELHQGCLRLGALLRSRGLKSGDTVSVVMPNGLMTLRLLLGTMFNGLCVNPVNLLSQPDQMRYVLGHSDCKLVFVAPEGEGAVRAHLATLDRPVELLVADPDGLRLPGEDSIDSSRKAGNAR